MVDGVLQLAGGAMATAQRGMQFIANDGTCGMVAALNTKSKWQRDASAALPTPVSADYRLVPSIKSAPYPPNAYTLPCKRAN